MKRNTKLSTSLIYDWHQCNGEASSKTTFKKPVHIRRCIFQRQSNSFPLDIRTHTRHLQTPLTATYNSTFQISVSSCDPTLPGSPGMSPANELSGWYLKQDIFIMNIVKFRQTYLRINISKDLLIQRCSFYT